VGWRSESLTGSVSLAHFVSSERSLQVRLPPERADRYGAHGYRFPSHLFRQTGAILSCRCITNTSQRPQNDRTIASVTGLIAAPRIRQIGPEFRLPAIQVHGAKADIRQRPSDWLRRAAHALHEPVLILPQQQANGRAGFFQRAHVFEIARRESAHVGKRCLEVAREPVLFRKLTHRTSESRNGRLAWTTGAGSATRGRGDRRAGRTSGSGHERTLDIRGEIADNFAISDLVGVSNAAVGNSAARHRASLNFT